MRGESEDPLLAAWAATLSGAKEKPALFNTRREILRTFAEIEERSRQLDRLLIEFEAGEVIGIQIGNNADWPSWLLACLRRQLVVLPLEQRMGAQEYDSAIRTCGVAAVVAAAVSGGSADHSTAQAAADVAPLRITASTAEGTQSLGVGPPAGRAFSSAKGARRLPARGPVGSSSRRATLCRNQPPALLKLTSGTTAAPRAIRFRSEQLLADCTQICETMEISARDLNFAVIPLSHSYGFSNLLTPLLAHGVPMVLSHDQIPRAILNDLAVTGATVFPGMPVFYQAFCELQDAPQLKLLRLCISAGAPLSVAVAKKFREKFKRPIHTFYGSSECGGICYDRDGTLLEEGFVGAPMSGVDLQMLDPGASASRIRVQSAAVGEGYFPEPDEEKLGNSFFIPDDLLCRSKNGFRIVGRVSDLINVAGKKVNPAEIEAALLCFPGVRQAVVFGRESPLRNEEVAACVVAADDVRETNLLEFCRGRLSRWQVPKHIFFIDAIPVSERGKTSRRDLARHFSRHKTQQFT